MKRESRIAEALKKCREGKEEVVSMPLDRCGLLVDGGFGRVLESPPSDDVPLWLGARRNAVPEVEWQ